MRKLVVQCIGTAILSLPFLAVAQEQGPSSPDVASAQVQPASAPLTKAEARAKSRAERKEAARQRRQLKNAELKKLQDNGYGPQANPEQYPENLTNAERKTAPQSRPAAPAPASGQ
ncbi:hypothetical protein [Paraburkholderia nodosa]|uniref:hypothetical protein n=1 Tax=Paraburkholderia nodosa TaxID=392320 RepID=UPI0012B685A9|nr:hypothetical protein [Paraburkholderia nodosa]